MCGLIVYYLLPYYGAHDLHFMELNHIYRVLEEDSRKGQRILHMREKNLPLNVRAGRVLLKYSLIERHNDEDLWYLR